MDLTVLFGLSFIICSLLIPQTEQCVRTNNDQLPSFQDYHGTDRITLYHQAIIPSYMLTCCGEIRAWGVDVHPAADRDDEKYTLHFQVWRPSPTVDDSTGTGCAYSLVGNNRFTSILLSGGVAQVTPSPQKYIQFRPGDVLGFYVEEAREDNNRGVAVLTTDNYTMVGCPISVGSAGDLNTMLRGAPVISIATETSNCPQVLPTPPPCPFTPPPTTTPDPTSEEPISSSDFNNMASSTTYTVPDSSTSSDDTPPTDSTPGEVVDDRVEGGGAPGSVIAAVVLAILVVIMLTIFVSVLVTVVVSKKKRTRSNINLNLGFTNQLQAVGGNSGAIEAELEENEAYIVTSGEQELATHFDESMYSYPVVDTDQSIETTRNNAYAVSIVTEKNEAYNPVSTATGRTADEYDYITT